MHEEYHLPNPLNTAIRPRFKLQKNKTNMEQELNTNSCNYTLKPSDKLPSCLHGMQSAHFAANNILLSSHMFAGTCVFLELCVEAVTLVMCRAHMAGRLDGPGSVHYVVTWHSVHPYLCCPSTWHHRLCVCVCV